MTLEGILTETASIPAKLPNVSQLADAVSKAREWIGKVKAFQVIKFSEIVFCFVLVW